ncbi:MAG: sigma-70 family RNA polymerase sigma factor, partial [Verrucomicrobiota bacterium]|nr:sigma-70 family RNA polymerase sigma factor [Verrucomicrobiota bacterium]
MADIYKQMHDAPDMDLLRKFAQENSEEAFATLVSRHVNMVYSAALRKTENPHAAEEISQAVFIILAKKAGDLRRGTILSGWLYQTARLTAGNFLRNEIRRAHREQEAYMQSLDHETAAETWQQIAPHLDDALGQLGEKDRNAIALRFFEGKSFQEVGSAFGASENAAKKRVAYALEKLRNYFSKHGIVSTTAIIAGVVSTNSVQAAPVGLAINISTAAAAIAGTTLATAVTTSTIKTIAMTTLQKTLITVTLVAAVGAGIYEAHKASTWRAKVQTLQQQQVTLAEKQTELKSVNERLSRQLAQSKDSPALAKAQFNELLTLRGKVGVAQANSNEIAKLKSTIAEQNGRMPDYMTNAMAMGLGTAETSKRKAAQAKLARMKQALTLTDNQAQAISDLMQKHIHRQTEIAMESLTGKLTTEQRLTMAAEGGNQDDEIKALLTAEQLAAYPQYQQGEKTTAADKSAISEASQIADNFNLSKAQQKQIHAAFYQMNLNEPSGGLSSEAIAAAGMKGNLAEAASMRVELEKSQLE